MSHKTQSDIALKVMSQHKQQNENNNNNSDINVQHRAYITRTTRT